jgi:hypothetical protein
VHAHGIGVTSTVWAFVGGLSGGGGSVFLWFTAWLTPSAEEIVARKKGKRGSVREGYQ